MNSETLGDRMKACVDLIGSRKAAADVAGITVSTLDNYLGNSSEPRATTVLAIAKAAGVSTDWLISGDGAMRAAAPAPPVQAVQVAEIPEAVEVLPPHVISFCAKVATGAFEAVKAERIARDLDASGFYDIVEGLIQIESHKGLPGPEFSPNIAAYRKLLGNKKL